jgi:alkylation response protein AidB-like acyl-CoA dehydrogenase
VVVRLLARDRAVCDRYLPELDGRLAAIPLMELEKPGNVGIAWFREAGGAGLLIPKVHGGGGASAVDAIRLTRALASRSPSLAVATTMHQFSVASLVALAESSGELEWTLLDGVARDKMLMASGFAEGRTSQSILTPSMKGVWDGSVWRVSGRKQPCSLSRSMDLLTASVLLQHPEKGARTAIALIPAASKGVIVRPFWKSWVLAGAESDSIELDDVEVHPDQVLNPDSDLDGKLGDVQTLGFIWFELLVTACYLGVAASLVERVLVAERGPSHERVSLCVAVEGAAVAIDGAARMLDEGNFGNESLANSLIVRFMTADTIRSVTAKAVELLGGMAFVSSSDIAYLAAASHAIGFHPPSRNSSVEALLAWFSGRPLILE